MENLFDDNEDDDDGDEFGDDSFYSTDWPELTETCLPLPHTFWN